MTTFLKKIVDLSHKNENVDVKNNIIKFNKDLKSYQEKVKVYITDNYVEFLPTLSTNELHFEEGAQIMENIENMKEELESDTKNNIYGAHDDLSKCLDELEEISLGLAVSMKLLRIDTLMQKISQLNQREEYSSINVALQEIYELLSDSIISKLDMSKNVRERCLVEHKKMMFNLEKKFQQLVQMKEKSFPSTKTINIVISKDASSLIDSMNALLLAEYDTTVISKFLLENIFESVISRPVSLDVKELPDEFVLNLSYSLKTSTELRPTYKDVFANLKEILLFLLNMNVKVRDEEYLFVLLFEDIKERLIILLISQCILHAIPETIEEMNVSTLQEDIVKLNKLLNDLHFFDDNQENRLSEFASKIDEMFQKRFAKKILETSTDIMRKDLHEMQLVSENVAPGNPTAFPRCMISKSTQELISLLEQVLKQAHYDDNLASSLFTALASTLDSYPFTIKEHHAKFLSKIPQQAGLFYNNCQYLAFWIVNKTQMTDKSFETVAKTLMEQGQEIFDCQVEKQEIQLLEVLKDFDLPINLLNLTLEYLKPIRQCIRQLDLLKNVWQTILPTNLYNSTIGSLLDVICGDLIKKILKLDDISSSLSTGFVELMKEITSKGAKLFEEESSAPANISLWQKMFDLQFILDASLIEIGESWKGGKLPQSFKADEVKHLIRALFQNTDRRANALSIIV